MSGAVRGKYVAGGGDGRSCYVCGELGHLAKDCCRRAVVEGSGPVCCFVCGKPGHLARYCHKRARPKRGSGGGRSTSLCREQGNVGVARESGDGSRRVGAIAAEISHSSPSDDDDDEEEKRVLVESMNNNGRRWLFGPHGVVCKNSTGSLNATVRMEEEKDDDDDDDCVILDYNPFQPPTVDYKNKFSRSDRYLSGLRNKGISVVSEQGQLALSSGDPIRKEISFLSSYEADDDDYDADNDEEVMVGKKSTSFVNAEVRVKKEKMREEDWEDDESCIILDFDPFQPSTADFEHKLSLSDHLPSGLQNEDIFVTSERGQVACRDYPHSRYHCAKFPFSKSDHENYCPQCYCYVCDIVAPCEHWKGSNGHCHASDDDWAWMVRRMLHRHNVS